MCRLPYPPMVITFLSLMLLHIYASGDFSMEVTGNTGFVASPNHPYKYPKNISCLWNITAESGYALNATVLTMDMEKAADCHADFLQMRTSSHGQWKDYKRYCSIVPAAMYSESGWMQVRFVSDAENEFTGFNLTWSAVEKKLQTPEISINLRPSPSITQNCIGVQIFYDTVTISTCIKASTDVSFPKATVYPMLNSTNCLCGRLTSTIYPSLFSSPKLRNKLQTSVQTSSLDTNLKSSLPTMTANLVESSQGRTEILSSLSTYSSSVNSKPLQTRILRSSDNFTASSKDMYWTTVILPPSDSIAPSVKEKPWTTAILQASGTFASSVRGRSWKTEILKPSISVSSPVKAESWTTEYLQSSKTIFSSASSMSWRTGILQPSNSYLSRMHWVNNETRNADISSSIQTAQIDDTSTGFLYTSYMPVSCQEIVECIENAGEVYEDDGAKVDSIHSSLVKILWPVGGTFLFVAILFVFLLCRDIKSNRIEASCD